LVTLTDAVITITIINTITSTIMDIISANSVHQCCCSSFAFQSSWVPSGNILQQHRQLTLSSSSSSSSSSSIPPHNERNLARCKLLASNFKRVGFVACKVLQFFTDNT
jgi:hypothetical protein